jgi:hypothetical protein
VLLLRPFSDSSGYILRNGFEDDDGSLGVGTERGIGISTAEALAFAAQLDEVRALVEDVRFAEKHFLTLKAIYETHGDESAEKWSDLAGRFGSHLAPFETVSDEGSPDRPKEG